MLRGFARSARRKHSPTIGHSHVRPRELRKARWGEFNLNGVVWGILAAGMKTNHNRLAPLGLALQLKTTFFTLQHLFSVALSHYLTARLR